jgi:uncharacterized membrane protein YkvA (DUF1232 family)
VSDPLLVLLIVLASVLVSLALVVAFVAWKVLRSDERKLVKRIGKLGFRDKLSFARDVMRDSRFPAWSKLIAGALVVYLASPIDLIPDFIPILGHLDDLAIALIAGALLLRSVPDYVIDEHLRAYETRPSESLLLESGKK